MSGRSDVASRDLFRVYFLEFEDVNHGIVSPVPKGYSLSPQLEAVALTPPLSNLDFFYQRVEAVPCHVEVLVKARIPKRNLRLRMITYVFFLPGQHSLPVVF